MPLILNHKSILFTFEPEAVLPNGTKLKTLNNTS